ncbi:ATP12 family protein [Methylocapsa polymorpha]|uniref:ATP12 family protein n=1 Tax=Methylocapsa polymorpha TaxID=3080828 RepID=A0ABZ0HQT3_9HYPH|nr:ATP12 family protein [Methylocapsa sp. RX1]
MSDDPLDALLNEMAPRDGEPIDPAAMARRDLQKALPKRFYKEATAQAQNGAFVLLLDGRGAKTPARNKLALPTLAAAEAVAAEWAGQDDVIDPLAMPLTRIVNSTIDGVAREMGATADEIAKFAGSDLVCYRAGEPEALVRAQAAAWDPVLDFARERLGARFICAEGVIFVEQPEPARRALKEAVGRVAQGGPAAPFALAALHVMTTLTGSALIALAVAHGELTPEDAWAAAHVDEDFQMRIWGADEEALRRRARRWKEMEAAAMLWGLVA